MQTHGSPSLDRPKPKPCCFRFKPSMESDSEPNNGLGENGTTRETPHESTNGRRNRNQDTVQQDTRWEWKWRDWRR